MQKKTAAVSPLLLTRRAGILLHPTSLPNSLSFSSEKPIPQLHGNLGKDAYAFVDFLASAGISIWQMLPTGPTHADRSPYQSVSSHAGNPELISIDWLIDKKWVIAKNEWYQATSDKLHAIRIDCAAQFYHQLNRNEHALLFKKFNEFCSNNAYWLDDFVLFMALRKHFLYTAWNQWPEAIKKRHTHALNEMREVLIDDIQYYRFEQFAYAEQWKQLREYANNKNITLFGDIPIFVAHDSADVWAAQAFFNLDDEGNTLTVAGVPPDYFSETGQHWGNPHYHWQAMETDGFSWWLNRLRSQLNQFDLIRIDHFRGFEAFWEIPGNSKDARLGKWVKAPGEAFLTACFKAYPTLPLVAENLGLITPEVEALRHQFHLPGMLVLQFAFDGNMKNPHLPHHHTHSDVIYTGTHDNDTTLGWYQSLPERQQKIVTDYLFSSPQTMPWLLIDAALASVAPIAIIPMQDILELDGNHRMNMPGTTGQNWSWEFDWQQLPEGLSERLRTRLGCYDRLV
jgi:4-alpha-glucanotransferase